MYQNTNDNSRSSRIGSALVGTFLLSFTQIIPIAYAEGKSDNRLSMSAQNVQLNLQSATSNLDTLEKAFVGISRNSKVTLSATQQIDKETSDYARSMKAALDIALKDAATLAETKGKSGSIDSLRKFEETEKANLPRLEKIERQANSLQQSIKVGKVKLDSGMIQNLSVPERKEFLTNLEVPARKIYINENRGIFKPIIDADPGIEGSKSNNKSFISSLEFDSTSRYSSTFSTSTIEQPSVILPNRQAFSAVPCIGYAKTLNWALLTVCIANSGSQAKQAFASFENCWKSARGWTKWIKRAACLTKFIAKLA